MGSSDLEKTAEHSPGVTPAWMWYNWDRKYFLKVLEIKSLFIWL